MLENGPLVVKLDKKNHFSALIVSLSGTLRR
jgi:hypothetical protein